MARQGVNTNTVSANNPKAKFKASYIRYRIYNKDGTYHYGKKYITRKDDNE